MRVRAACIAVSALVYGISAAAALAQDAELAPECKSSQIPTKVTENGKVVIRCVRRPGTGTPAQQFGDFIHGNSFRHAKHEYAFCASSRFESNGMRGTYRITTARRVTRKGGSVTITAKIRLRAASGKRSTLRAVLTTKGVKINGSLYRFAGPAPPSLHCSPG